MAVLNQAGFICLIDIKEFSKNLPSGWRNEERNPAGEQKIEDEDGEFLFTVLVTGDKYFKGRDTCFELNSEEDLQAARDVLMRRPIFTTVKCSKYYNDAPDTEFDNGRDLITEYVVLINTGNPAISSQFGRAFEMAESLIREGKKFRITINLSKSFLAYYNGTVHANGEDNRFTTVRGCDIYLTHGVKAPNFADRIVACQDWNSRESWKFCFLCCLCTGIPYLCYKKYIKGVIEKSVKLCVPIVKHNGPFQTGYNLQSLLLSLAVN